MDSRNNIQRILNRKRVVFASDPKDDEDDEDKESDVEAANNGLTDFDLGVGHGDKE